MLDIDVRVFKLQHNSPIRFWVAVLSYCTRTCRRYILLGAYLRGSSKSILVGLPRKFVKDPYVCVVFWAPEYDLPIASLQLTWAFRILPGKPAAQNYGLLCLNTGLLYGVLANFLGYLGVSQSRRPIIGKASRISTAMWVTWISR